MNTILSESNCGKFALFKPVEFDGFRKNSFNSLEFDGIKPAEFDQFGLT